MQSCLNLLNLLELEWNRHVLKGLLLHFCVCIDPRFSLVQLVRHVYTFVYVYVFLIRWLQSDAGLQQDKGGEGR